MTITCNTVTWVGRYGYHVTRKQLTYMQKACKLMELNWKTQAACAGSPLSKFIVKCCDDGVPVADMPQMWLDSDEYTQAYGKTGKQVMEERRQLLENSIPVGI